MSIFIVLLVISIPLFVNAQPDYARNVVRRGDEVYLRGFRPQMQKGGTCSFYSTSMILDYYGQYVPAKRLRRKNGSIQESNAKTSAFMSQKLETLGFIYIYNPQKSFDLFCDTIKYAIDNGIPLRWECSMKFSPIPKERRNSTHARIILGYKGKNRITHIIYADSWGATALHKVMTINQAHKMTVLYGPIFPKKDSQDILAHFQELREPYCSRPSKAAP